MAFVSKALVGGIAGVVALLGASGAALAGGDVGKPAISANWSGIYVGASAGYGWGESTMDFRPSGFGNVGSPSIDGPVMGLHAGIQHQSGRIVGGLDVTLLKSGISGSSPDFFPTNEITTAIDRLLMINAKLGVTMDNSLFYITGGFANGAVSSRLHLIADPSTFVFSHETMNGWNLGAGIEYRISNTVVAGIEYRHIDLGSVRADGFNTLGFTPSQVAHDVDYTADVVTARVTILLGRGDSAPSRPMK